MIDFTNAIEEFNNYKGSEKKKTLIYNDKKYLVKFPDPVREKNKNISYINNAFSEYIGSNVFKIVGFKTQNTVLGKYEYNGKEKIVCACEDFTDNENVLYEFENLALSTNPDKKIETELDDIMEVIEESKMIDTEITKRKFWDMFIIDSLIGNTDRHNGNWGFLLNNYSCLKENGKKINYMIFIKQMENEECNSAIKRLFANINIDEIKKFINNIECMSDVRKEFYKKIIEQRYNIIKEVYGNIK